MGFIDWIKSKMSKTQVLPTGMHIIRDKSGPTGTYGKLYWRGEYLCETLEDQWFDNKSRVSCIPLGTYKVTPHGWEPGDEKVLKYTHVWHVQGVPGRSAILIHNGNTTANTIGCILVGEKRGRIGPTEGITNSMKTLNKLREKLPPYFTLTISGVVG